MDEKKAVKIIGITKKTYQLIGSEFSDTRQQIWPEMEELVKKYVKQGDKVLDVGCGNGRLVGILTDVEYLGIDTSDSLIAQAKKKLVISNPSSLAGRQELGRINFKLLDILELDKLDENNFDVVFCFAIFNHIAGQGFQLKVLADIKKLLKPSGRLIMTNWNMWQIGVKKSFWKSKKVGLKDVMTAWKSMDGRKSGEIYYRAFTKGELKRLLRKSGFKILENYYSKDCKQAHWWSARNIVTVGQN